MRDEGVNGVRDDGNPSLSEKVADYMLSLQRRKVQAGDIATSERAVKHEDIKRISKQCGNSMSAKPNWVINMNDCIASSCM
jgi:hypothetical protein